MRHGSPRGILFCLCILLVYSEGFGMTKDDPNMKPLPCVRRRGTSPIWHYWKPNPDDLLSHPAIGGKQWACRISLQTVEANARAAAKLAELEAYWATLRAGTKPTAVLDVTPGHDGGHA